MHLLPPSILQFMRDGWDVAHVVVNSRLAGTLLYLALVGIWVFVGIRLELKSRL